MEKAMLPTGIAHEPNEGAQNPMAGNMSPRKGNVSAPRLVSFADNADPSEKSASQKSYKEVLSQPALELSYRQKLLWLQKRRTSGLWVQCDDCDRWRYLSDVLDSHELPNKWYCRMNPDSSHADCSVPESPIRLREEEDLIHSAYSAGSVVWARLPGWPWWPAMVADCPDTEQFYWLDGFSDIPTHYNVVFFDSAEVTRAWISPENLKPFNANKKLFKHELKDKKYKSRLQVAVTEADDASKLPLEERLSKYSFVARYKGNLNSPKKVSKRDLIRYQKKLKSRFNIEFPIELSDSDDEVLKPKSPTKKRNMILLGTPKMNKIKRLQDNMDVVDSNASTTTTEKSPLVRNKTLEDSMNVDMVPVLPKDTETILESIKQPNSMQVQVGSTTDTVEATESYDNDTSKTYVPEKGRTEESTENDTEMGTQEFQLRAITPNSDDFDF